MFICVIDHCVPVLSPVVSTAHVNGLFYCLWREWWGRALQLVCIASDLPDQCSWILYWQLQQPSLLIHASWNDEKVIFCALQFWINWLAFSALHCWLDIRMGIHHHRNHCHHHFWHAPHECVAPHTASSLQSGRFWALLTASVNLSLWVM